MEKTSPAITEFLRELREHQIAPTISRGIVRSPSVRDCWQVRRAARVAAYDVMMRTGHKDPRRVANALNAFVAREYSRASQDAAEAIEDGVAHAVPDFAVFPDDFQHAIFVAALTENIVWTVPGCEFDNLATVDHGTLSVTLGQLMDLVAKRPARRGPVRVVFRDGADEYRCKLEASNLGISVSCTLNCSHAHQLAGLYFVRGTEIGEVFALAAGDISGAKHTDFFASGAAS